MKSKTRSAVIQAATRWTNSPDSPQFLPFHSLDTVVYDTLNRALSHHSPSYLYFTHSLVNVYFVHDLNNVHTCTQRITQTSYPPLSRYAHNHDP